MSGKSRSKEKGGEPESGRIVSGRCWNSYFWRTDVFMRVGEAAEASAVLQLQRGSQQHHRETEHLTCPRCSS